MERVSDTELQCSHCGLSARTSSLVTASASPTAPPTAAERAERDAFDRAHAHEQPPDESKWQPQSIVVEGLPVLFQSLRVEHAAVAQAVVGVLVVAIRARRWDLENLVLVEVDDFSEYERGSAEMRRRLGF